jgi:hypothetical protein
MNETQQVATLSVWISLISLIAVGVVGWVAWSAHRAQLINRNTYQEFQDGLRSLREIEKKADRAVVDRVGEHLRSALGSTDSVATLSAAILSHPLFLDQLVRSFKERLDDPDDDFGSGLTEKILESVTGVTALPPETQAKIRSAVSEHLMENIPDLLSGDDDLHEAIMNAFQEEIPVFVKEMFASNDEFRTTVVEAVSEKISNIFENN